MKTWIFHQPFLLSFQNGKWNKKWPKFATFLSSLLNERNEKFCRNPPYSFYLLVPTVIFARNYSKMLHFVIESSMFKCVHVNFYPYILILSCICSVRDNKRLAPLSSLVKTINKPPHVEMHQNLLLPPSFYALTHTDRGINSVHTRPKESWINYMIIKCVFFFS